MQRPPLEPPRPRRHAPGGAARAAGAAVLIALAAVSAACRGNGDATHGPATTDSAATPIAPATPMAPAAPAAPAPPAARAAAASDPSGALAEVDARLDRMLKDAEGCTAEAECRTVAIGGKACGGPTGYRAYSAKGADPQAVEDLARQERELAHEAARASGRVSNCLMLADPGARCVQGRCVTGGPNAPRGAATR